MRRGTQLSWTNHCRRYGMCGLMFFGLASSGLAQDVRIVIDASKVENRITPLMYGSCIEDVNHEIYGGFYDQKIFGESFEERYPGMLFDGFKHYGGNWEGGGNLVLVERDGGAKIVYDETSFSDGSIEVDMRFSENREIAGLIVRVENAGMGADNFDGYEISLNARSGKIILGKHANNWQPLQEANATFASDEWNRLRVELSGARLQLFLNDSDKPLIDYTDRNAPFLEGKVGLRTWNSDVLFKNLKIKSGEETVWVRFQGTKSQSGPWDYLQDSGVTAEFSQDGNNPFNGKYSQKIQYEGGFGKAGMINRSLNRWGIAVKEDQTFQGRAYLRSKDFSGPVHVSLQSVDGSKTYATQMLGQPTNQWGKYSFTLKANATDTNARFVIWMENKGTLWIDQVVLMGTGDSQFKGLPYRADIGNAMVTEGLTFLRYGGTMINAPEYRFKKMIGDPDKRPPYRGHWYRYSTNGFGIEDFLKFCEAAGFEASFAINIEETPEDMADMVEYLNGDVTTAWGKKRAENGHPKPYNVKYIEIGNEEVLFEGDSASGYDHYIKRFNLLYDAMIKKDPDLKIICAAWWIPDSKNMERVFRAVNGKAAYWDYHPWADDPNSGKNVERELIQMQEMFRKWDLNTTLKCAIFEENGNTHNMARALGHATILNATRRQGDFLLTSCQANALQPYKQNDNGWDQGQIFFTPSQVWAMPHYYAQQMASKNHMPLRVLEKVEGMLDVTATRSEDGKTLILHVVNTQKTSQEAEVMLQGFAGKHSPVQVWTLAGDLNAANTPEEPEKIVSKETTKKIAENNFTYRFQAHSYTILRFSRE